MLGYLTPWKNAAQTSLAERGRDLGWSRMKDDLETLMGRSLSDWRGDLAEMIDSRFDRGVEWDEQEDRYVLNAKLPGFDPQEIEVKVFGDEVTLQAEHQESESSDERPRSFRMERISQSFPLPPDVDHDRIDARCQHGVLTIEMMKGENQAAKRIPVSTG